MRYDKARKALIFWCLFIGIGAVFGSMNMLFDPTGKTLQMNTMLSYFEVLPFSDILFKNYIFSGIALLIVNGITNIVAAILLIKKKKLGIVLGTTFGITLMLWIIIQFVIFPFNILSTTYFIFGITQALTGYACYIFYTQEQFKIDMNNYKNIGTNKNEIVVYFSRMGYTKKIALERANETGAEVLELTAKEKTNGTSGFWWCGRFGLFNLGMPIENIDIDLTKYDKVTICSPIWVFNMCAPIRTFCNQYANKLKNVDYVLVHFRKSKFINVADEMDNILGKKRKHLTTICSKVGKIKYCKELD